MKVLNLRFKNLNSLRGEWNIDFTDPAYSSGAIFAIIGPTGSGKTTILDAMSLALYGKTPRLPDITKATNEILSSQTGECFSEVVIETSKGTYCCHWEQHRADKRATGDLQQPNHEISDVKTGKVLASKKREVLEKIIEVTGLDFNQFTRSILLAQGGFAAFLDAKADERSPILEQITGTEVYSIISAEVHKRTSDERRKLDDLQTKLGMIQVLTAEEEDALNKEKDLKQKNAMELSKIIKGLQDSIEWRKRLNTLEKEILALNTEKEEFNKKKENAQSDLERLELAKKADKIEKEFTKLDANRQQQKKNLDEFQGFNTQQPLIRAQYDEAVLEEHAAAKKLEDLKKFREEEKQVITQVRNLDVRFQEAEKIVKSLKLEHGTIIEACDEQKQKLALTTEQLQTTTEDLQEIENYLSSHENDEGLTESIAVYNLKFKSYHSLDEKIKNKRNELKKTIEDLTKTETKVLEQKNQLKKVKKTQLTLSKNIETQQKNLSILLKNEDISTRRNKEEELRLACDKLNRLKASAEISKNLFEEIDLLVKSHEKLTKEHFKNNANLKKLEKEKQEKEDQVEQLEERAALLNRVRDLENERLQLEDERPCPLCGSPDHPYARGNVPKPDKKDAELKRFKKNLKDISEKISAVSNEIVRINNDVVHNKKEQVKQKKLLLASEKLWESECKEFGLDLHPADKNDAVVKILKTYEHEKTSCHEIVKQGDKKDKELREKERDIQKGQDEISRLESSQQTAISDCKSFMANKLRIEGEIKEDTDEIKDHVVIINQTFEKYGYKDSDPKKWPALIKTLLALNKVFKEYTSKKQQLDNQKNGLTSEIGIHRAGIEASDKQLESKNTQITEKEKITKKFFDERSNMYGEKDPDVEENRIKILLEGTEAHLKKSSDNKHTSHLSLQSIQSQMDRLNETIKINGKTLQQLETTFQSLLQNVGFLNENAFLTARLQPETFEEFKELEVSLMREAEQLQVRIGEKKKDQDLELKKDLTQLPVEKLSEDDVSFRAQLEIVQNESGAILAKLTINTNEKERQHNQLAMLERQQVECGRWERLHTLIGSSDGKKFRNFAQGLTFDVLIAHANQHLQKMSDRYLLFRSALVPLDLNVVDNYQAGEIRSTKNLSGGESFIVSLALALGLSGMASHNVRIDSFFLDEGFGTLDDEALDSALITLSGLQQEGKLIGVISHVAAIKERITTQIVVERKTGGQSLLKGPGCKFKAY